MDIVQVKEDEQNQHPKRIKTQETFDSAEEEDRISSLSDSLIIDEILSRLDYTKEAIRTGTLSKRWQHLWTSVPTLIFLHENQSPLDFYLSVNTTLTQCRHRQLKKLNKFQFCATYDNRFEFQVNNWIRYVTNCQVQQLYLNLWYIDGDHQFVLKDDSFFINSHFTHLHLGYCIFNPTGPITWNNLNTLSISSGKLDQDLIANILSGSPLLDTLRLESCYGYSRLDITSKSVKNLEFSGYSAQEDEFDDPDHIIEINAPYISSLTILDNLLLWKLLLLDVSSLVKASLNYTKSGHYETTSKEEEEEMLKRFILNLRHVQQLDLYLRDTGDEEALFVLEDDSFFINSHFTHLDLGGCIFNPTGPITWNNLTTLSILNGKLDQDVIANILSGSPLLDTLKLANCYGYSWLDITSKSVKNLIFWGYAVQDDDNLDHIIEINAPYISSLTIGGVLLLWKILLQDVSSLVKADLDYTKLGHDETTRKEEREEMLKRFILRLHHVKELKIGISCYTAFSRLEAKGFIFPSNLKVVEVTYPLYDTDSTELGDYSDNDSSVGDSSGSV